MGWQRVLASFEDAATAVHELLGTVDDWNAWANASTLPLLR